MYKFISQDTTHDKRYRYYSLDSYYSNLWFISSNNIYKRNYDNLIESINFGNQGISIKNLKLLGIE